MTDRTPARTPREVINNAEVLKQTGLSIVHINKIGDPDQRSMTVAFERINSSHLKVSTAVCHSKDRFSRKVGTKTAVANFAKGNTIIVPLIKDVTPSRQIKAMFDTDFWY